MTRLALATLVLLCGASVATELFAQANQTSPPVPLVAPTLNTTTLTCQINCDTQAMNCQNSCLPSAVTTPGAATGRRRIPARAILAAPPSSSFANSAAEISLRTQIDTESVDPACFARNALWNRSYFWQKRRARGLFCAFRWAHRFQDEPRLGEYSRV